MDLSTTHVIAVISNPIRFESRYKLFQKFRENIERKGSTLWSVEMQHGQRPMRVTNWKTERDFQVHSTGLEGIFWNKENLQNYVTRQMTAHVPGWRKVIYTDADVLYSNEWLEKTCYELDLHPIVQPWSHSIDFAPDGSAIGEKIQLSFAYAYCHGIQVKSSTTYTKGGHPGYSIAMRRESYNDLGGLIDIGALGSGDRHQMCALVGKVEESYHPGVSPGYKRWLHQWQDRAERYIKRNIGYVPEVVRHMFHGAKKNRQYGSRWKHLTRWQFDPYTDIKPDAGGLWVPVVETPRQVGFRDATYRYHPARQEDANSL